MTSVPMQGADFTSNSFPFSAPLCSPLSGILHAERKPSEVGGGVSENTSGDWERRKSRRQRQVQISSALQSLTEEGFGTERQLQSGTRLLYTANESTDGMSDWATDVPFLSTFISTKSEAASADHGNPNATSAVCVSIREEDLALSPHLLPPEPKPEVRQVGGARKVKRVLGSMVYDKDAPFHLNEQRASVAAEGAEAVTICDVLEDAPSPTTGSRRQRGKRWTEQCNNNRSGAMEDSTGNRTQKEDTAHETHNRSLVLRSPTSQSNLFELLPSTSIPTLNSAAVQEEDRKMANYYARIMKQVDDSDARSPDAPFPPLPVPGTAPADGEPRKGMKLPHFDGVSTGPLMSSDLSSGTPSSNNNPRHADAVQPFSLTSGGADRTLKSTVIPAPPNVGGGGGDAAQSIPAPVFVVDSEPQPLTRDVAEQHLTLQKGTAVPNVRVTRDPSAFSIVDAADMGASDTSTW